MLVSSDYSFGMDNSRLLKGFLRLRNGGIMFIFIAIIMTITGILYPIYFVVESFQVFGLTLWFFELVIFFLVIITTILIFSSLTTLIKYANVKRERLLKFARILLLVYHILFVLISAFTLAFHLVDEMPFLSMTKNLITCLFLAAFLLVLSFSFKVFQENGYGTRLLYIPLIFLAIPSLVGFIMGFIYICQPFFSDFDILIFSNSIIYLYLCIFLISSFLEISLVLRRMTKQIDVQYVMKSSEVDQIQKTAVPAKK